MPDTGFWKRLTSHRHAIAFAAILAVAALSGSDARGGWPAIPPSSSEGKAAEATHELTQGDLDGWLDRFVPPALAHDDIAGAVVVVVRDNQVLAEKGYGFADVAAKRRVDPQHTVFRLASVSKLFTWTAVLQLVEQGKLDLDTDINSYLDFKIPNTWPKPITLRNLMTHTSGFEEANKNTYAPNASAMPDLGTLLKSWAPERMYPPGTVVAYSNYGAALAGYIVQRVSHERFEDYVGRHILLPLGMTNSTFVQPLPELFSRDLSKGYVLASGPPMPFEYVELRPAGGLSSTGADMARFMMAHLGDGALNGAEILGGKSASLMHAEAFRQDPALPGMALGFWHLDRNGHVIVAHTGDTVLFHSGLYLVLDAHTGLFVVENSAGSDGDLPRDLFDALVDRYFPGAQPLGKGEMPSARVDGEQVAGTYENSRRADSSFMIAEEVFNERTVTLNPDDTLTLSGSKNAVGDLRKWKEIAPFRWRELGGDRILDAKVEDGRVVAIMTDATAPISVLMRASFWRSGLWNVPLFLATIATLALIVLLWPVSAILRWCLARPFPLEGEAAIAWKLARVAIAADLVFLLGWAEFLGYSDSHVEIMNARIDWLLRGLQIVGVFGVLGAAIAVYAAVLAFAQPKLAWWSNAWSAIVAATCLSVVWFAFSLKLISWTLNY